MSATPNMLAPSLPEIAFAWLNRVVAVYCLMFGFAYWVRLVGIYPGDEWRFDLMPVHWQVASVTLAALFPFASIGLWMLASWGAVVWFICAVIETFMYWWRADLFGSKPIIVLVHLLIAAAYLTLVVIIRRQRPGH